MARAQNCPEAARGPGLFGMRGSSLVEVLLAVWVLSSAALGALGLQIWVARSQQSAQWHMQAVGLVGSVAETLRSGAVPGAVEAAWQARVGEALPHGRVSVLDRYSGVVLVTVSWSEASGWGSVAAGAHAHCPAAVPESRVARCVRLAVAR